MKRYLPLFLIPSLSFALECGNIPEGKVIRIDQGNGSLAKAAIQDQDGLGTCYANLASLLLQSSIPNNPNLSYLNLALFYANNNVDQNAATPYTKIIDTFNPQNPKKEANIVNGGQVCKTIQTAIEMQQQSKRGVLCKASDVNLEHQFFKGSANAFIDGAHVQEKSLLSASRYLNSYKKSFDSANMSASEKQKKRDEADSFSLALQNFIQKNGKDFLEEKCSRPNLDILEEVISDALTSVLYKTPNCVSAGKINTKLAQCKSFHDLAIFVRDHRQGFPSNKIFFTHRVRTKLREQLPNMIKSSQSSDDLENKIGQFISDNFSHSATKKNVSDQLKKNLRDSYKDKIAHEVQKNKKEGLASCANENFLEFFASKTEFLEKAKQDAVLCNYTELLEKANEIASIIPRKTVTNLTDFIDFLVNKPGLKYDDALLSLIATDCSADQRVSIPQSFSCANNSLSFTPDQIQNNQFTSAAQKTVKERREKIFAQLENNTPVGVEICTKFWNDPSYKFHGESKDTKWDNCAKGGLHGYHAVAAVGYRCKNNKVEYLAQNSWGPNWELPHDHFEIENGKIWISEDELFMNTYNFNFISK